MKTIKSPTPPAVEIVQPFSLITVSKGEALDHLTMRASQLVDLLDVLGGDAPSPLMWLAQQITAELDATLGLVIGAQNSGGAL